MEKKIAETATYSNEPLVTKLLNIIDELELAIHSGENTENTQALLEGVKMTLKKLYSILGEEGMTQIESVGKCFDPEFHEVVMKVPNHNHKEGEIIEEIRKGFLFKKKVIRQSMVRVATDKGDS
jgi:molecular chaperone GrpE